MRIICAAASVCTLFPKCSAAAGTAIWSDSTGDWFNAANWSSGAVPDSTVVVQVSNGGTAQIASGANVNAVALRLGNAPGTSGALSLSDGTLTTGSQYLGYGPSSSGTISQSGGLVQPYRVYLGDTPGGTGFYAFSGGTLAPSEGVFISTPSSTFLQTGGTLSARYITQSAGLVQLTALTLADPYTNAAHNAGDYSLTGGTLSTSSLLIQSGGTLSISSTALPSTSMSSTALLSTTSLLVQSGGSFTLSAGALLSATSFTVTGGNVSLPADATLDSGSVSIAFPTPVGAPQPSFTHTGGTVTLTNAYLGTTPAPASFAYSAPGVAYRFSNLYLGRVPGSSATFTLNNGSIRTTNEYVGYAGAAAVTQTGGTHTVTTTLRLGYDPTSTASYTLAGGTLSASDETIGATGFGIFTQTAGSHFVSNTLILDNSYYSLSGGTLSPSTEIIGAAGPGTLTQTGGSNHTDIIRIGSNGTQPGYYTLTGGSLNTTYLDTYVGSLTIAADASATISYLQNGASLALPGAEPGTSAGHLSILNTFSQTPTGSLLIGIGGTLPHADYPVLDIGQSASLDGSLTVTLSNNFTPSPGDTFTLLTFKSRTGSFSSLSLPPNLTLSYTPTSVLLTALPEPTIASALPTALLLRRRRHTRFDISPSA